MLSLLSAGASFFTGPKKESSTVESILSEFDLDNEVLKRMMRDMSQQMDAGLIGGLQTSTIAMLPTFVPFLPSGSEQGQYLAMDLGGSNLRVMLLEVANKEIQTQQINYRIPNSAMTGTGTQLFDFIVSCLATFLFERDLQDANLPLGFTFSYPCDQSSIRSAVLVRWTKGFNASGVEGQDVVTLLEQAIARCTQKLQVRVVALVNDTVGTMVATAFDYTDVLMGVIVATGTNAAYMELTENIKCLHYKGIESPHKQMIIDTEWGGFGDHGVAEYIKTQYDLEVDRRSVHPGLMAFDKLVAGMYMGELVRLVLLRLCQQGHIFNGHSSELLETAGKFPTKYISEVLSDRRGTLYNSRQVLEELDVQEYRHADLLLLREVCLVVSRRSANLAAAAIACVINRLQPRKATIGIDGSTYRYLPFYHAWVQDKLQELLLPGIQASIVQTGDGSGKGAALVAAIAESL